MIRIHTVLCQDLEKWAKNTQSIEGGLRSTKKFQNYWHPRAIIRYSFHLSGLKKLGFEFVCGFENFLNYPLHNFTNEMTHLAFRRFCQLFD